MELLHLPDDPIQEIILRMSYPKLLRFRATNTRFRDLVTDDIIAFKFAEYVRDNMGFISVGYNHFAFIDNQGQLYMLGNNEYGQLGLGHTDDVLSPVPVVGHKVVFVSCGADHTAFINNQGQLYVIGNNYNSQISN